MWRGLSCAKRAGFPVCSLLAALVLAGCSRPLPEADSADARLYAERCGVCHAAYHPGVMTAAMWETMVARMEKNMRAARIPELTGSERTRMMDYLSRNASGARTSAPVESVPETAAPKG